MLITKEEHEMALREKDNQIRECMKALDETKRELVELQKQVAEQAAGGEPKQYYINVPVEKECLSCPKLELQTAHYEDMLLGDIKIHECKHLNFCREIRSNWEDVNKINRGDNGTQM